MAATFAQKLRQLPLLTLLILAIIAGASALRIKLYGNPALSVANNDTVTYVDASRVPLFSLEIMSGRRLLTTNLMYKTLVPEDYAITVNGSLSTSRRAVQPGFEGIVIFQLVMSIIGWGFLAFTIAEYLRNPYMKALATILIMLFAFTPQMADWDSILMSESPTFSMFAILFALMIRMAFALHRDPQAKIGGLFAAWVVVYFFWTFIKDINLFVALITLGMIAALLFFTQYRKRRILHGAIAFLFLTFLLGAYTSGQGPRPNVQIGNLFKDDILTSPLRTEILRGMGMPEPETGAYYTWIREHGRGAFLKFVLTHPGYPATKLIRDFPHAFEEIGQTYFKAPDLEPSRTYLMDIGKALHPESASTFLMNLLLLGGVLYIAVKNPNHSRPWAWLGLWLFIAASFTILATILADTWAVNRHSLYSTMSYRLGMWLFALVLVDLAIEPASQPQTQS